MELPLPPTVNVAMCQILGRSVQTDCLTEKMQGASNGIKGSPATTKRKRSRSSVKPGIRQFMAEPLTHTHSRPHQHQQRPIQLSQSLSCPLARVHQPYLEPALPPRTTMRARIPIYPSY